MRGTDNQQDSLFSYSAVSDFVPAHHPLRRIRALVDEALDGMRGTLLVSYSHTGRPSVAPERIIRALLLQVLYSIRSERQLVEQIRYNMLYRWFVGLSLDDAVWDASTFSKNRERFVDHRVTGQLLEQVVSVARRRKLLSEEHFSVDGSLVEAWASMGSYRRKDDDSDPPAGPPDFRGESRRSDTHECKTDPDARLYRKGDGQPARLCYITHALTDNRHALVVDAQLTQARGTAEVDAALDMLNRRAGQSRLTVGADRLYDQQRFIDGARAARVTPHVAQNTRRRSSCIDGRTTRHAGYAKSIHARHRVETPFGWGKFNRSLKRTMLRGLKRVGAQALLVYTGYNLVRMVALEAA
ncbi:IS5 family transposase [Spectribacter hydrogenoxidans]|uniref:IS5 family transposase n=1 Tax=Spectribacter hydrogenoxidans TaxID=3075608 RepID=A0ABU3C324_9GAMM|nr:IS5 family transposase [Salinisphaera sp. W335]MDT0635945.1 IS5 family transposase [Salinisphaera sp. W335]